VVNLVSSSIEPQTQVADPVPSSINPTLHQKSVTQVVDLFSSSVDPTLPLENDTKAVDPFPPINPILPLENETQVVDLVLSSIDPTPPLMSAKVADSVPSLVSPTLPLKSACMVDPIPSSVNPTLPLKSACVVDPTLPLESKLDTAHIFLIDTESTVLGSILSSIAWHALGCPHLALVTQNLLAFNRRTSQPLGTLPQFSVTLGGKTVFIDVMVV
jgi:hypothetical protein